MVIAGRCHCGNITFALAWDPDPLEIPARACSCTFCRKHGGVWTAHPGASLRVTITDRTRVSTYAFGTHTAEFHVCTRCGVVPVVTSRIADHLYAVVNVNAFENVPPERLRHVAASFDGETEATRVARRQRNWIADVTIAGAS